jgi:hypothetical protein
VSKQSRNLDNVEPVNGRPGESGIKREQTWIVWNGKRGDYESLEPEKRRPGEYGTGREEIRKEWN